MVNVAAAVKGAKLEYGTSMENDSILQDWLNARQRKLSHVMREGFIRQTSDFRPLTGTLLDDVMYESSEDNLVDRIRQMANETGPRPNWLRLSEGMAKIAKALGSSENQRLLGLALSFTTGKPLRYCIQSEVRAAVDYWTHYSTAINVDQEEIHPICVAVLESSSPLVDAARTICPILAQGSSVLLCPKPELALPCLILAEIINQATDVGTLFCRVYIGDARTVQELSSVDRVSTILCGGHERIRQLEAGSTCLKLNLEGKKAIVAMETADCDGAVDAALSSLKMSSPRSPGFYLLVQDSMMDQITWRLRERFGRFLAGSLLDKSTDVSDHQVFAVDQRIIDYLETISVEVVTVGNARIVLNAQPSMPLTQWNPIGQTLLVMSFRTTTELNTLLANLTDVTDVSLWAEQHSTAWQVADALKAPRVWLNGVPQLQPGCDEPLVVQDGVSRTSATSNDQTNVALYPSLDSLRNSQRAWASQSRGQPLVKFLMQLASDSSLPADANLTPLLGFVQSKSNKGRVVQTSKDFLSFELNHPVGIVALVATNEISQIFLVECLTIALLHGNAVALCVEQSTGPILRSLKDAGLSHLVFSVAYNVGNLGALAKHHGVHLLACVGDTSLPVVSECMPGSHLKSIWRPGGSEPLPTIENHFRFRKWIWMPVGDGLAV